MSYSVRCGVDKCPFEERTMEDLDSVYALQAEHQEQYGDHHILEFDRLEAQNIGAEV